MLSAMPSLVGRPEGGLEEELAPLGRKAQGGFGVYWSRRQTVEPTRQTGSPSFAASPDPPTLTLDVPLARRNA